MKQEPHWNALKIIQNNNPHIILDDPFSSIKSTASLLAGKDPFKSPKRHVSLLNSWIFQPYKTIQPNTKQAKFSLALKNQPQYEKRYQTSHQR